MYLPTYFQLREYIQNVFRTSIFMGFFVTCTRFYVRSRGSFYPAQLSNIKCYWTTWSWWCPSSFCCRSIGQQIERGRGFRNQTPFGIQWNFLNLYVYRNAILNSTQGNLSSNCENFLYSIKVKSLPRCYVWAQVHTLSPLSKGYLISESFLSSKKMFQITILSTIRSTIRLRRIVICNLFWRMEPKWKTFWD